MDIDELSEHDLMVFSLVEQLKNENNSSIKADLNDYDKPDGIHWRNNIPRLFPDVTARKNDTFFIFAVETVDSLSEDHSHHQRLTFSEFARNTNSVFGLVVPKRNENIARDILIEKNIFGEVWGQD